MNVTAIFFSEYNRHIHSFFTESLIFPLLLITIFPHLTLTFCFSSLTGLAIFAVINKLMRAFYQATQYCKYRNTKISAGKPIMNIRMRTGHKVPGKRNTILSNNLFSDF